MHYRITKRGASLGKVMLVLSPVRPKIRLWRSRFPRSSYKHMLQGILKMGVDDTQLNSLSERIDLLYPPWLGKAGSHWRSK